MFVNGSSALPLKKRRLTNIDPMAADSAKAKLAAVKEKYGRAISVFETSAIYPAAEEVSGTEETDDFYDLTAEDYYRVLATKKEDKFLKTRKLREAEAAAQRSTIKKAVIRVHFPDNHILEATFHPSETIQSLVDLLLKVVARPDLPFYIYTTPPKKQIKDTSQDFYSAGFVPGAIVYFSYDLPKDSTEAADSGCFLQEEIISLKDLALIPEQLEPIQSAPEPVKEVPSPAVPEHKPAAKKSVKPKWLKM